MRELARSFQEGRFVHAFFIYGERGCGKRTLARVCARALLCQGADKPCGVCGACQRVLAGTHPDSITLAPKKSAIGVDEVRQLLERLKEKPYEGGNRAVVIENADRMTPQAQNALLKSLEEPEAGTVFFLLAEHPEAVLPTIKSRCRLIKMGRLPQEAAEAALRERGASAQEARRLYALSDGILGRALEMMGNPAYDQAAQKAVQSVANLRAGADLPAAAKALAGLEKEEIPLFLDALEEVLRDAVRVHLGLEVISGLAVAPLAQHFTIEALHSMMEGIVTARKRINANVSWASAVEPLLFQIVEGYQA